ncbi:hypothetical protein NDU88_002336 [Pleurodeles waltl]|uniref:Uncharacterized protein n=1 Tax=Pleurodeles waltl TaxID=8319 RepID=A0AAV7Q8K5_PLEWA|nr:hypothetical protein NDU88_002336 [Pleurodeles waltl]
MDSRSPHQTAIAEESAASAPETAAAEETSAVAPEPAGVLETAATCTRHCYRVRDLSYPYQRQPLPAVDCYCGRELNTRECCCARDLNSEHQGLLLHNVLHLCAMETAAAEEISGAVCEAQLLQKRPQQPATGTAAACT